MVHYDVTSSGDINFPTLTSVVSGSAALMTSTQAILSNVPSAHSESMVLNRLAASVLCREPTSEEKKAFRAYLRDLSSHRAADAASQAVEDMMWAYLNSSEFVLVH